MLQTLMWRSLRLSVASVALAGAGHVLAQSLPPPGGSRLGARPDWARCRLAVRGAGGRPQARTAGLAGHAGHEPRIGDETGHHLRCLGAAGPTYVWRTPVYLDGVVDNGAFAARSISRALATPNWCPERLWLMLGRLQGMGVKVIVGDIVVDRSAFQVQGHDAAAFDGEPFKPYNAGPDALLINYKTQVPGLYPRWGSGRGTHSL